MRTETRQSLVHLMVQGEDLGPLTMNQVRHMLVSGGLTHDVLSKFADEWIALLPLMTQPKEGPPLASKWYIKVGEEEKGPFTFSQLQNMWNSGTITADTVGRQDEPWQPLYSTLASRGYAFENVKKAASGDAANRSTPSPVAERPPNLKNSIALALEPEIKSTFLSVCAWILMIALVLMPLGTLICGICVMRGWYKRRTLKVLRHRSWETESFVSSIWIPAFLGFLWRSFLVFTAIGFAFGIGARLDEMAQISIILVIWVVGIVLSIDVPYWIKKRLVKSGCRTDDPVATMKATNTRTKIAIVTLCAAAATVIFGFILYGMRPSVPNNPPVTEADKKEFFAAIAEAKQLEKTGFLGTFKTANREVKLELRMQQRSGQPKGAILTAGEGTDAVVVEGTWFVKDPSHVVIQLKGGDPFLYELQNPTGQIELRGMGLIFYRQ